LIASNLLFDYNQPISWLQAPYRLIVIGKYYGCLLRSTRLEDEEYAAGERELHDWQTRDARLPHDYGFISLITLGNPFISSTFAACMRKHAKTRNFNFKHQ
jgi:hypothetical protein